MRKGGHFYFALTKPEPGLWNALQAHYLKRHLDFVNREVPKEPVARVAPAAEVRVSVRELGSSLSARLAFFAQWASYSAQDLFLDPILEP